MGHFITGTKVETLPVESDGPSEIVQSLSPLKLAKGAVTVLSFLLHFQPGKLQLFGLLLQACGLPPELLDLFLLPAQKAQSDRRPRRGWEKEAATKLSWEGTEKSSWAERR